MIECIDCGYAICAECPYYDGGEELKTGPIVAVLVEDAEIDLESE